MKHALCLALAALSLSACSTLLPPSREEAATLPIVRFGESAPAGKDYILLYPGGVPLPMAISITGNLFDQDQSTTLNPRLKRDIYLYKTWASYDGKDWQRATQLVGGKIELHLPGEEDSRKPGSFKLEFNEK